MTIDRERIDRAADRIAALLDVEAESVAITPRGVLLTPDQAETLLALVSEDTVDKLRRAR